MRWFVRELCYFFLIRLFLFWIGESCNVRCELGFYNNGLCFCCYGFWGFECEKFCFYVNGKLCGEEGICNM